MKVFIVIKKLESVPGGAERVFTFLCNHLVNRGHAVVCLSLDGPDSTPFYPLDSCIETRFVGRSRDLGHLSIFSLLEFGYLVRKEVKKSNPDLVISFMHSSFIPVAVACVRHCRVFGSEHIVFEHYKRRPIQLLLYYSIVPFLELISVPSEAVRDTFPAWISRKMVVVNNPIWVQKSEGNINSDVKDRVESRVILNIGRCEEQKDHATLIKAFSIAAEKWKQWDLWIVGTGSLRTELLQLIQTLNLEDRVKIFEPTPNIDRFYHAADIFALSSKYESFGLVVAEALTFGVPVVAYDDCTGINQMVNDKFNGILVSGKNIRSRVDSFAVALTTLISQPKLLRVMSDNARLTSFVGRNNAVLDRWEQLMATKPRA